MPGHLLLAGADHFQTRGWSGDALDPLPVRAGFLVTFVGEFHDGLTAGHHQINFGEDLGVKQRAVQRAFAVVYQIAIAEGVEAVALAGEQLARHLQGIGDFAEGFSFLNATTQHAKLVIHKADVERRVMDDQFAAANILKEVIGDVGKRRLVGEEFVTDPVNAKGFGIDQTIGLQIDVEIAPGQATVNHLNRTDFNDSMPLVVNTEFVHTGGFGIENDLSGRRRNHIAVLAALVYVRLGFYFLRKSLPEMTKQVEIFTDGSCLGNPGPGGFGAILRYKQHEKEFSAGFRLTTNNRMELMAAIVALEALTSPCEVTLSTDSQYVRQGITSWIHNWKKRGWKTADKKPVKNVDLWQRLDAAIQGHKLNWMWVKGHAGHPENERCDVLARDAAGNPTLDDVGYKPES